MRKNTVFLYCLVILLPALLLPATADAARRQPPMVDAGSDEVSTTLTDTFLEELPTGRTYSDAAALVAGVAVTNQGLHIHGGAATDNVWRVTGANTTDAATGGPSLRFPWEGLRRVKVITGGQPLVYGGATGGVVNVVSGGSGNTFHGSVPLFYSNTDLHRHQRKDHWSHTVDDFQRFEPGAALGGPLLRDKLWFFAAYNNQTTRYEGVNAFNEAISRSDRSEQWHGKLTWMINEKNKLKVQYADNPSTMDSHDALNPQYHASAYAVLEHQGALASLQWTSILHPDWFIENRVALHTPETSLVPANADWSDDRYEDQHNGAGTEFYGNIPTIYTHSRPRRELSSVLHHYREWAGVHNLIVGVFWESFKSEERHIYPDSYVINRPNNWPDRWAITTDLETVNEGSATALFAEDAWDPTETITVRVGLRWDWQDQTNDVGEQVYCWNGLFAPRVGIVWDPGGNGKSRVFARAGRYHDTMGLELGHALNRRYSDSWISEWDEERGEWYPLQGCGPELNTTQVNPDLQPNRLDEFVAGYEVEFKEGYVAAVRLIHNRQNNMINDVIANEEEIIAGGRTYVPPEYLITNVPSARRHYTGLELETRKRLSHNFQYLASYTLSRASGSVAGEGAAEGLDVYADFAEVIVNRHGDLPWDDRHVVKAAGSYHLPFGMIVGGIFNWRSGRPYNRIGTISDAVVETIFLDHYGHAHYLDPRGSHRLGHVWWLDLRLSKDFAIGEQNLRLMLDAFNVTNNQTVTRRDERDGPNWGQPTGWMEAGYFVLGARYSF